MALKLSAARAVARKKREIAFYHLTEQWAAWQRLAR